MPSGRFSTVKPPRRYGTLLPGFFIASPIVQEKEKHNSTEWSTIQEVSGQVMSLITPEMYDSKS